MSDTAVFNLTREVVARHAADTVREHRRIDWLLRMTSLWTPLAVFALALVPYVVLTQFVPGAASWAQPLVQGFGLVAVLATVGLAIARFAVPRFGQLRRARVEAEELLGQLTRELKKASPKVRDAMLPKALELDTRWHGQDAKALDKTAEELMALADAQLPGWKKRGAIDAGRGLVITLLGVLLLRTFVVEPFRIPSGSMLPTLEIGDHVVVNRFIYGVRIPWLNKVPFVIVRSPKRGDVIVFVNPLDESRDYIKRVIGVPGDRIEIRNEVVYVNGEAQPQRVMNQRLITWEQRDDGVWYPVPQVLSEEDLSGVKHAVLALPHHPKGNEVQGPYTVPAGAVFVMGDNRDRSGDSRFGFSVPGYENTVAFVPYGYIKGKAMVVWLSLGHDGVLSGVFGGTGLRVDRLFTPVR